MIFLNSGMPGQSSFAASPTLLCCLPVQMYTRQKKDGMLELYKCGDYLRAVQVTLFWGRFGLPMPKPVQLGQYIGSGILWFFCTHEDMERHGETGSTWARVLLFHSQWSLRGPGRPGRRLTYVRGRPLGMPHIENPSPAT